MKRLFLTVGLGIASLSVNVQTASPELVSSAGDRFNNTTYQLDRSIGECVTATHSAGDFVITQGLHQNTYVITAVEDLRADILMSVYPNPQCNNHHTRFNKLKHWFGRRYERTRCSHKSTCRFVGSSS